MKQMNDKIFLDTNILIYAYSSDEPLKRKVVEEIIENAQQIIISTQVINEFINVMSKKRRVGFDELTIAVNELSIQLFVAQITISTIKSALKIAQKYNYSYFDSLILASALEYECSVIYTEDMHNQQIVETKLKIDNPFISQGQK